MLSLSPDLVKSFVAPLRKEQEKIMAKQNETAFIFRSKITINGVTYYAKDYGKKAFRIPVSKSK